MDIELVLKKCTPKHSLNISINRPFVRRVSSFYKLYYCTVQCDYIIGQIHYTTVTSCTTKFNLTLR